MRWYVVVEGLKTEKAIYDSWIKHLNPAMQNCGTYNAVQDNSYFIVAGYGYPNYLQEIKSAIDDINANKDIGELVIGVDSENMEHAEKNKEIQDVVDANPCHATVHIIVQHFCIETWLLGNKKVIPRSPQNKKLKEYKKLWDVVQKDPEGLPPNVSEGLNRAQFALKYLRTALVEKGQSYSKNSPGISLDLTYLDQLKRRVSETTHIPSFKKFLDVFEAKNSPAISN